MVAHAFNPVHGRQRQVDQSEFESGLVYKGVPGQPGNPVSKRHKNKNLSPTESKMHSNLIYCSC